MIQPFLLLLRRSLKNKHTTGAAIVIGLGELASGLASIWCPQHQTQVDATVRLIEKVAIGYGFIMAGDADAIPPAPTKSTP